ncbi:hypothetical protein [Abyssalbus ytuae]|uniref:Uncharacterized protein n=1 Tax=Abyssalbus ytuae TaxID=2926907 RepID=A0A9E7CSW2_9FLAO|nr:hypothetical protein [Abyssalbus ytuae]UOB16961.1 hypothetical protein MQE35_14630 [Abyssalbus ytuae]
MILKKTNVEEKLRGYRKKDLNDSNILQQVKTILGSHTHQEHQIQQELKTSENASYNSFNIDLLETDRIYHIDHIKKICIDYRLRFLDTRYFKGKFPQKALSQIKILENTHNIQLKGFKIIAPSKLFKLENADDPLLFAPIGNDYYYLIHKWGNDLHPLRKYLMLPFKNFLNLTLLILIISYFLTELIPMQLFSKTSNPSMFWLLFIFMFKMVGSIVLFYGVAHGKNFNYAIWNSKYFNA